MEVTILGHRFSVGVAFVVAAFFAWGSFYFMDRYWYHVLLGGAVAHAGKIEKEYAGAIPGIGLGQSLSEASRDVRIFRINMDLARRLNLFYGLGAAMLTVVFLALLFAQPRATTTSQTTQVPPSGAAVTPQQSAPTPPSAPGAARQHGSKWP